VGHTGRAVDDVVTQIGDGRIRARRGSLNILRRDSAEEDAELVEPTGDNERSHDSCLPTGTAQRRERHRLTGGNDAECRGEPHPGTPGCGVGIASVGSRTESEYPNSASLRQVSGTAGSCPLVSRRCGDDVDHVAVGVPHEEPSNSPRFQRQRMDDLVAEALGLCVGGFDPDADVNRQ
jgi:hypothetical protein